MKKKRTIKEKKKRTIKILDTVRTTSCVAGIVCFGTAVIRRIIYTFVFSFNAFSIDKMNISFYLVTLFCLSVCIATTVVLNRQKNVTDFSEYARQRIREAFGSKQNNKYF